MHMPELELHETTTLDQAAALMARLTPDARLLAGGTDLLVDLKTGRVQVRHLVSLNRIDDLHGISQTDAGLRIGALATITQLDSSPIVRDRYSPVLDATSQMAARQIRNVATVGGNIASAVPCADLPPILVAMNATVTLWSPDGERTVPLDAFFAGPRQTAIQPGEIMTAVNVPNPPAGFGAAYERFALREGNAIAVAAVAASLLLDNNETIRNARIVLGAVAPIPKLVKPATDHLIGKLPTEEAFAAAAAAARAAAEPISDVRGSADYRRELVATLTRRALATALARAKEARS